MDPLHCPFAQALLPGEHGCRFARPVTRREGPDISCDSAAARSACATLHEGLTAAGLAAFGGTEDPGQLPHAVQVKIQVGGLLGLQRRLAPGDGQERVRDVAGLVEQAVAHHGSVAAIPCGELAGDMTGFQLRRRRGR